MNPTEEYFAARDKQVQTNTADRDLHVLSDRYMQQWHRTNYVKSFSWMGIPVMQLPQDLMAMQELIWKVSPDVVIETGVAFGGMTAFYANLLNSLGGGKVFGVDKEIREHTWKTYRSVQNIFDYCDVRLIEKSSVDKSVLDEITTFGIRYSNLTTLISLDSNHTHEHVLQELRLYSPLVSVGSYIVVFDTTIEWLTPEQIGDRPWGPGNSPWSAVQEFMKGNDEFVIDKEIENRILLTSAVDGWLRRIR